MVSWSLDGRSGRRGVIYGVGEGEGKEWGGVDLAMESEIRLLVDSFRSYPIFLYLSIYYIAI